MSFWTFLIKKIKHTQNICPFNKKVRLKWKVWIQPWLTLGTEYRVRCSENQILWSVRESLSSYLRLPSCKHNINVQTEWEIVKELRGLRQSERHSVNQNLCFVTSYYDLHLFCFVLFSFCDNVFQENSVCKMF